MEATEVAFILAAEEDVAAAEEDMAMDMAVDMVEDMVATVVDLVVDMLAVIGLVIALAHKLLCQFMVGVADMVEQFIVGGMVEEAITELKCTHSRYVDWVLKFSTFLIRVLQHLCLHYMRFRVLSTLRFIANAS